MKEESGGNLTAYRLLARLSLVEEDGERELLIKAVG